MLNERTVYVGRAHHNPSGTGSYIYNTLYKEIGINAVYLQFTTSDSKGLSDALRVLGFRGCTVVGLHAKAITPFVDEMDDYAAQVGKINTVVNQNGILKGFKTDGPALVSTIKEQTELLGKRVTIVGAGSIASELARLLPMEGVAEIALYDRTIDKARILSSQFSLKLGGDLDALVSAEGDVLINASAIGAAWCETKDAFPEQLVDRHDVVADVTFQPTSTALQDKALRLGKKVASGTRMFAYQGQRQVELYLGISPSIDRLHELVIEEFQLKRTLA